MERKDFLLKLCGLACICFSADLLTGCTPVQYVEHSVSGKKVIVKKSAYGENKYVVVKNDRYPTPIYLTKNKEGKFIALLMQCTHKQCELTPYGNLLHCPCHGSEFDNKGTVLNPPADQNLFQFKVSEDNENITIEE